MIGTVDKDGIFETYIYKYGTKYTLIYWDAADAYGSCRLHYFSEKTNLEIELQ